jgi:hypothetical protein
MTRTISDVDREFRDVLMPTLQGPPSPASSWVAFLDAVRRPIGLLASRRVDMDVLGFTSASGGPDLVQIDRRLGLLDERGDYFGTYVLGVWLSYAPPSGLVRAVIASSEEFSGAPAPQPDVGAFQEAVERSPAFTPFTREPVTRIQLTTGLA